MAIVHENRESDIPLFRQGIDFDYYGLKLGMVFKGTTRAYNSK